MSPRATPAPADRPSTGKTAKVPGAEGVPVGQFAAAELSVEQIEAALDAPTSAEPAAPRMKRGMVTLLVLAYAGVFLAFITPQSFSLAIRIQQIDAAGRNTTLALTIGIPAVAVLFTGPIAGVFSDRSRSRLGRRRPFLILGAVLGLVGSSVVAFAPSVVLLIVAWTVGFIGYALCANMIVTHLGDRLSPQQRGRISGVTGSVQQVAPVIGIVVAGTLVKTPALMFLIPAVIAFLTVIIFAIVMHDRRLEGESAPVQLTEVLKGFWFSPRKHPDLGWVWLSRALMFVAIGFTTVYTVYFLGQRLHLGSAAIATLVATSGIASVLTSILGALLCGYLSDRFKRRKPFLFTAGLLMAAALVLISTITSPGLYVVAVLIVTFAIGAYGAVDQATALDVIPREEGQNGRYLAIVTLGNQLPQAIGPFVAGGVVAASGGNYGAVYISAAVAAVLGAIAILPLRLSRAAAANETTEIRTVIS